MKLALVMVAALLLAGCVRKSEYYALVAKEARDAQTVAEQTKKIGELESRIKRQEEDLKSAPEHQYAAIVVGIMNNDWRFAGPACEAFLKNHPESELAPAVRIHLQEATKKLGDIDAYKKQIEQEAKEDEAEQDFVRSLRQPRDLQSWANLLRMQKKSEVIRLLGNPDSNSVEQASVTVGLSQYFIKTDRYVYSDRALNTVTNKLEPLAVYLTTLISGKEGVWKIALGYSGESIEFLK